MARGSWKCTGDRRRITVWVVPGNIGNLLGSLASYPGNMLWKIDTLVRSPNMDLVLASFLFLSFPCFLFDMVYRFVASRFPCCWCNIRPLLPRPCPVWAPKLCSGAQRFWGSQAENFNPCKERSWSLPFGRVQALVPHSFKFLPSRAHGRKAF